ncbi:MAG: hypothetical protein HY318_09410 [Armatimonadetes bacterium]|nr:hypothetical protein [Armatimonadota bacterium]
MNLVSNPSFERGQQTPEGWEIFGPAGSTLVRDEAIRRSGQASARISITTEGAAEYPSFKYARRNVFPGELYLATVSARTQRMTDIGGYIVLEFFKGTQRLSFAQGDYTGSGDHDWMQLAVRGMVPGETDCMKVVVVAHGVGDVWFDDVELIRLSEAPTAFEGDHVLLRIRHDQVFCRHFYGFGAHGDFLLTRKCNTDRGVDGRDRELVLERVKAMRPHIIRTLFAYQWWEPEEGKQTPDSEEMRDYIYWVRFLKSIGTSVLLTPWGDSFAYSDWMRDGTGKLPRPEKREAMIRSLVDLVGYLRQREGLTNIKYLCLMNEPDNDGTRPVSLDEYVRLYRLLDQKLRDRGVRREVFLLTSDDSFGNPAGASNWFRGVVSRGLEYCNGLSSHAYKACVPEVVPWVRDRLALLKSLDPPRKPKPLFITEFGHGGETFKNWENGKYEYGLFLADFAINAVREGASAVLPWCLMDTYYSPDAKHKQEWGLWRYKSENWEPRPGFYSWSLITRYTRPGSQVLAVENQSRAPSLSCVAVRSPDRKLTVLLVNGYKRRLQVTAETGLKRRASFRLFRYTREAMSSYGGKMINAENDLEASRGLTVSFELPGESFALLTEVQ